MNIVALILGIGGLAVAASEALRTRSRTAWAIALLIAMLMANALIVGERYTFDL